MIKEEEFKLPKHWCVKWTKEVGEWYDKVRKVDGPYSNPTREWNYLKNYCVDEFITDDNPVCSGYSKYNPSLDCPEITIEQFMKYVVNEPEENYSYLILLFKRLNIT